MLARAQDTDLDTGPKSVGTGTQRLCAATRTVRPVAEMIRFVVAPSGEAVPDLKRKLPGRGIWITATRPALAEAIRRGAFARSFGRPVKIAPDLIEASGCLLERSALDALAIAGKAGQVVTGFRKVEAALTRDQVIAMLHAREAAADGIRKIAGAMRRRTEADGREIAVISAFAVEQLSLALGRPNVVHAALLAGPAAQTFLARSALNDRFRAGDPGHGSDRNTPKTDA
jgi:uncharacterized protein